MLLNRWARLGWARWCNREGVRFRPGVVEREESRLDQPRRAQRERGQSCVCGFRNNNLDNVATINCVAATRPPSAREFCFLSLAGTPTSTSTWAVCLAPRPRHTSPRPLGQWRTRPQWHTGAFASARAPRTSEEVREREHARAKTRAVATTARGARRAARHHS